MHDSYIISSSFIETRQLISKDSELLNTILAYVCQPYNTTARPITTHWKGQVVGNKLEAFFLSLDIADMGVNITIHIRAARTPNCHSLPYTHSTKRHGIHLTTLSLVPASNVDSCSKTVSVIVAQFTEYICCCFY